VPTPSPAAALPARAVEPRAVTDAASPTAAIRPGMVLFLMSSSLDSRMAYLSVDRRGRPPVPVPYDPPLVQERPTSPSALVVVAAAGLAVGLVMLGLVVHPLFVWAGVLVGFAALAGWLARASSESTGRAISLLPLGMPVLGLATIASVMFFLSRILLAVPEQASTAIALTVAVLILGSASLAAVRPNISGRTLATVLAIGTLVMVAGGITAAAKGERKFEKPGEEVGAGAPVQLKAEGVTFKSDAITLVANADVEVRFDNNDRDVQHNFAIYGADPSKPVFRGQLVSGVATATYKFHSPGPGQYRFQCDVHPTQMKGTVTVK